MNGESGDGHEDGAQSRDWVLEAGQETARTPWLVAGCNRPARRREEQTVGVGKNDKGGRCRVFGNTWPKVNHLSGWETGTGLTRQIRRRGDLWKIPREEVWIARGKKALCFGREHESRAKEGPHAPVGVFEGDAKDRRVVSTVYKIEDSAASGRPRRSGVTAPRPRWLVEKAKQSTTDAVGASEVSVSALTDQARAPEVPANFTEGRLTPPGEPRMAGATAKTSEGNPESTTTGRPPRLRC
jgi:hypothetical protein